MCRWHGCLDPDEWKGKISVSMYYRWFDYYRRNALHPLSVPMTIAIQSSLHAADKKYTAYDFVFPALPEAKRAGVRADDVDGVSDLFAGMVDG